MLRSFGDGGLAGFRLFFLHGHGDGAQPLARHLRGRIEAGDILIGGARLVELGQGEGGFGFGGQFGCLAISGFGFGLGFRILFSLHLGLMRFDGLAAFRARDGGQPFQGAGVGQSSFHRLAVQFLGLLDSPGGQRGVGLAEPFGDFGGHIFRRRSSRGLRRFFYDERNGAFGSRLFLVLFGLGDAIHQIACLAVFPCRQPDAIQSLVCFGQLPRFEGGHRSGVIGFQRLGAQLGGFGQFAQHGGFLDAFGLGPAHRGIDGQAISARGFRPFEALNSRFEVGAFIRFLGVLKQGGRILGGDCRRSRSLIQRIRDLVSRKLAVRRLHGDSLLGAQEGGCKDHPEHADAEQDWPFHFWENTP
ncbi:MAG: hypothetical protein BWZ10_00865 [candidate division BRC1 bacterium ADurb.BinA364]|nr:MAG: hypothetical protein BWZ10_00865 [candidate division BRC1 bacterium ADurb.BinA364]